MGVLRLIASGALSTLPHFGAGNSKQKTVLMGAWDFNHFYAVGPWTKTAKVASVLPPELMYAHQMLVVQLQAYLNWRCLGLLQTCLGPLSSHLRLACSSSLNM